MVLDPREERASLLHLHDAAVHSAPSAPRSEDQARQRPGLWATNAEAFLCLVLPLLQGNLRGAQDQEVGAPGRVRRPWPLHADEARRQAPHIQAGGRAGPATLHQDRWPEATDSIGIRQAHGRPGRRLVGPARHSSCFDDGAQGTRRARAGAKRRGKFCAHARQLHGSGRKVR